MDVIHIIILALIQGISEFLPISSSGHLALLPVLSDWPDQGLALDVAAHVGTLLAVLVYFRREVYGLYMAALAAVGITPMRKQLEGTPYISLFWALIIATLPVVIMGGLLSATGLDDHLRDVRVIAAAFMIFGLLLWWADRRPSAPTNLNAQGRVGLKAALLVGLWQVLALIPGASRAGTTMTGALLAGLDRERAARFSMLTSIPVIIAAGAMTGRKALATGVAIDWAAAGLVAGLSALFALASIHALITWVRRAGMLPFVLYRLAFGMFLYVLIGLGVIG